MCDAVASAAAASGEQLTSDGYDYDLFTIGGGSGGVRASRIAASFGAKVACAELPFGFISNQEVGGMGGTCVLRGCVPKKLMLYASEYAEFARDAEGFGCAVPTFLVLHFDQICCRDNAAVRETSLCLDPLMICELRCFSSFDMPAVHWHLSSITTQFTEDRPRFTCITVWDCGMCCGRASTDEQCPCFQSLVKYV